MKVHYDLVYLNNKFAYVDRIYRPGFNVLKK